MEQATAPQCPDAAALLGDGRALADILALAGPDMAPRILAQVRADLSATAEALRPALALPDWTAIRAQSHILISVAGTIGAMRLHALAIDLNTAAHAQDPRQTSAIAAPLMSDLDALTALLAARIDRGAT